MKSKAKKKKVVVTEMWTSSTSDTLLGKGDKEAIKFTLDGEPDAKKVREFSGKNWDECVVKYNKWKEKNWYKK